MHEYSERWQHGVPWNKGKLIGQKAPLELKEIWAIRIRLQLARKTRDLALFNLGLDSKLRGCDLVALRVCGHRTGWSCRLTRDSHATQDQAARSVRADGANARGGPGLDSSSEARE